MEEMKTRSQWVSEPSPLDSIFGNADVDSFVSILKETPDLLFESDESITYARKLVEGEPDKVTAPKLLKQEVSKFIRIIHGWHKEDYVWHIEPASIKRPWRRHENDVLYMIAKIMHDNLPEIEAKLWLPEPSWELRTITFKAMDLGGNWAFRESQIPIINNKLFEALNTIV